MSLIGTELSDRYRLDRQVGRGGMGQVFQGFDTLLAREVAVKVLFGRSMTAEVVQRLLREARATASLNHPNIVAIHDAGTTGDKPFIVMEMVNGASLRASPPADFPAMLAAARQVLAALEHAHQKGIIHRDLKPENILMTTGGQIKLVDFGLARSVASRLTKEGSIAGTVFYLAPEMAMGEHFDGRADLYSLGVILYEWTTGRLPFDAQDAMAVISQHIHAPVVPPRAINGSIPAALNALILRLLNKSPEDRPASASDLLAILSDLDLSQELGSTDSGKVSSLLDRVVRGRLIGRQAQLEQMRQRWTRVMTGEGQIVFLNGEAGIGKSRLVLEMATQVEVSGYKFAIGECYPEAGLPYEPFQQIIRGQLISRAGVDLEVAEEVLADLQTLIPGLSDHFPYVSQNPPLDPAADRFRFYENVAKLFLDLAARDPQLIVLEDIHWADAGTLVFIRHLSRRLRNQPLMLLLTYRESDLAADAMLNKLVRDLRQDRAVSTVSLPRLDKSQTQKMLEVIFGESVSPEFLESIYEQTEGNPYYVEEVCKHLVEKQMVVFEDGNWTRVDQASLPVPKSIQMAIKSRILVLSEATQEILLLASLLGREFTYDELLRASRTEDEKLLAALEEAEKAQLVSSAGHGARIRFSHHLLPLTLKETISSVRRSRLHLKVAQAFETDPQENFERLAFHFAAAGEARRACRYYVRAANRARDVFAMEDAARLYTAALALMLEPVEDRFELLLARANIFDLLAERDAQLADAVELVELAETLDDDVRRCDARLALADVYLKTDHSLARDPARQAVELARSAGDLAREGHALRRVGDQAHRRADLAASRSALETAAARFRRTGLPGETAACLSVLSVVLGKLGEEQAALRAAEDAVNFSRRSGDRRKEATSLRRLAIVHLDQTRFDQALPIVEEALRRHQAIGDRYEACNDLNAMGVLLVKMGRQASGEASLRESLTLAAELESKTARLYAINNLLLYQYVLMGKYERGLSFLTDHIQDADQSEDLFSAAYLRLRLAQLLSRLGSFEEALAAAILVEPTATDLMGHQVQVQILATKAALHGRLNDYPEAERALAAAEEAAAGGGVELDMAFALAAKAELALMPGSSVQLPDGLAAAERAVSHLRGHRGSLLDLLGRTLSATAGLQLELSKGNDVAADRALSKTSELVDLARHSPEVEAPEKYLFLHARALAAVERHEESAAFLQQAHTRVQLVHDQMSDSKRRETWLAEHGQLLRVWNSGNDPTTPVRL